MKNKIKIIQILFSINSILLFSQNNILVEYDYNNSFFSTRETLIISNNKTLYFNDAVEIENNKDSLVKKDDANNYKLIPKKISLNRVNIFSSTKENIFKIEFKKDYVIDSIKSFDWKIHNNETKKIGKYLCTKATTSFRGRNYIAYFTEELPFNAGPFKFKNLPGLILQIENTEYSIKHKWIAVKIVFPLVEKQLSQINFNFNSNKNKTISFEEYIINTENTQKSKDNIINSRLPKEYISVETKSERMGKEIKYEWEK
jgi:GLPGLI family protein